MFRLRDSKRARAAFHCSGWTQEELAAKEGKTQKWIDYRLRFGRVFHFTTMVVKTNSLPANLTERRFRSLLRRRRGRICETLHREGAAGRLASHGSFAVREDQIDQAERRETLANDLRVREQQKQREGSTFLDQYHSDIGGRFRIEERETITGRASPQPPAQRLDYARLFDK